MATISCALTSQTDTSLFLVNYSDTRCPLLLTLSAHRHHRYADHDCFCGRVFCGWLCPHNVFLEMVFARLNNGGKGADTSERSIVKKLLDGPRFIRKAAKWLFHLSQWRLGEYATAIFVGTEAFIAGIFIGLDHPAAAMFFAIFFVAVLFNVWFREQTCTIVCPYGRLQAAMLDANTLAVSYDYNRGEPRGNKKKTLMLATA